MKETGLEIFHKDDLPVFFLQVTMHMMTVFQHSDLILFDTRSSDMEQGF